MKRLEVELARMVRETMVVTVDVPDDFDVKDEYATGDLAGFLYANELEYTASDEWHEDSLTEPDEGFHTVRSSDRKKYPADVTLHLNADGGFIIWNGDADTAGG